MDIFQWNDYIQLNPDINIQFETEAKKHWEEIGSKQLRLCNKNQLYVRNEFGNELILYIPYYYYLYVNNLLFDNKISTYFGMKPYYYFMKSENIVERKEERIYTSPKDNFLLVNNLDYLVHFNRKFWMPPPYISVYKNDIFTYDKPLLIIHNKYNVEWDIKPFNYIDIATLDKILSLLIHKYQIIYIRPNNIKNKLTDKGFSIDQNLILDDFEDYNLISQKYNTNVILFDDLLNQHEFSYNELILRLFSNCVNYISVQGGNSYLVSYFAKNMAIYHKVCEMVTKDNNIYNGWFNYVNEYTKNISVADDYDIFIENIKTLYL